MRWLKYSLIVLILFIFPYSNFAAPRSLHLYGGSKSDVYLGCLTCLSQEAESIWNKNGIYGSKATANSIWNNNGQFGDEFDIHSAFNPNATIPPVIKDERGNMVGYFTADPFKRGRVETKWVLKIIEERDEIREDPSDWFEKNIKTYLINKTSQPF